MWQSDGDAVANRRFLVIGHGSPDTNAVGSALRAAQRRYVVDGGYLARIRDSCKMLRFLCRRASRVHHAGPERPRL
jgi:hypothetical protein